MYKKYPRTMNLCFSKSNSSDDVWLKDNSNFEGKEVVCSSKLDGEATTLYNDICHARSIDSVHSHHPSRSYVKALHSQIKHLIPQGIRICGENVYAKHSIYYPELTSYFYVYAIFENNVCISWEDVVEWSEYLGIPTVPVLYNGIWNEEIIKGVYPHSCFGETVAEGYVVRLATSFIEDDFKNCVGKFVRENHVGEGDPHWMDRKVVPNKLAEEVINQC